MTDSNENLMTSREVCKYCGFSISVLNKLESDGILKPKRKLPCSNRRLYSKDDVEAFLKSISTKKD